MQGQIEVMNRALFSKLINEKLELEESLEDYCRLVKNELVRKDTDCAKKALERMERDWSQTEEYVLLKIEYLALMNKGKEIKRFIKKVNESSIFFSSQAKEVLAFWTD
jgi:hypothetical protein